MDPAEGNVNHLHGLPEWAVTATLVRENQPVLTVVHLPLTGETCTALAGGGAHLDGRPLRVSEATDFGLSLVATSQARAPEGPQDYSDYGLRPHQIDASKALHHGPNPWAPINRSTSSDRNGWSLSSRAHRPRARAAPGKASGPPCP